MANIAGKLAPGAYRLALVSARDGGELYSGGFQVAGPTR